MNEQPPQILLATNGCDTTYPALEYGIWLAELLGSRVVLLGVVETAVRQPVLDRLLDDTAQKLEAQGIPYEVRVGQGRGTAVIAEHAHQGKYLTVAGPLGRPAWRRFVQGRSFRRLLSRIETPILYVPEVRLPLVNILLCMGGLTFTEGAEHLVLYLARAAGAHITLLHVVEPITLDYPIAHEVHVHRDKILETDTPQGRNLRRAIQDMENAGIPHTFRVRYGSAVTEIIEEIQTGPYDLIGIGSPHSAQSLRHIYMPNVTAEVAETIHRPVLAVRMGYDLSLS
jgi:nucleotide-binding universal stress UspA family protein